MHDARSRKNGIYIDIHFGSLHTVKNMLRLKVNFVTLMQATYNSITFDLVRSVHSSDFVCNTNRTAYTELHEISELQARHTHIHLLTR